MGAEAQIALWWVLFGGTHVAGSSVAIRTRLIGRLGPQAFQGLYSLVALATFVPLCVVYFTHKHAGAILFDPLGGAHLAAQALMLVALLVLGQALATPNPMSGQAELKGGFSGRARGVQRVTRHPQNLAFALFGLAHCIALPYVGDWLFFGGFVVYGVLSAWHQDRRTLAARGAEVREFQAETSLVPFVAITSGRQRLALGEYSRVALVASLVVFIALRLLHPSILGGFEG